ncbi:hypothetical protein BTZ20_0853 [Rhodococcus sp. MTM3W5.2]|nr:hypothetical protein BTZ20_0853 [Rhodococcus sp. MTM3W5.2]
MWWLVRQELAGHLQRYDRTLRRTITTRDGNFHEKDAGAREQNANRPR